MNTNRRAASRRKLIYFGIIAVLFATTIFVRGVVALPLSGLKDSVGKHTIREQARQLELTEYEVDASSGETQREAELTGSAVRLLLTGSRGFAICVMWITANEKQMRQEWNELELTVKSITTLQPHFVTPWLFQSWNLAYNVSVEMDRLNDMYFYISRGINLLSEGESINRHNPDMRYAIAFYYQNKFTVHDKVTTMRSLLQLSCMPADDRNPDNLMTAGELDRSKFRTFCEKYPQFVRRMREKPIPLGKMTRADGSQVDLLPMYLAPEAEDVVRFLRENQKIPTRYSKEDPKRLETRLKQFPVVPPDFANGEKELKWKEEWSDGQATAMLAARAWFKYANEAIPPPDPVPGPTNYNYRDPERRRRIPRQPMLIIFRQGPPRAQTYIAEQLSKDGWFDSAPWIVDEGKSGKERWFTENVEIKSSVNGQEMWMDAHTMWLNHGRDNGLNLTLDQDTRYRETAKLYAEKRGFPIPGSIMQTDVPPPRPEEQNDPDMRRSFEANMALSFLYRNQQVTNYDTFLSQARAEMDPLTVQTRKIINEAKRERRAGNPKTAISKYEEALGTLSEIESLRTKQPPDNRLLWARVLIRNPKFAESDKTQEDIYDSQINYLRLIRDRDVSGVEQGTMQVFRLLKTTNPSLYDFPYHLADTSWKQMWLKGPFDGVNPETSKPWINDLVKHRGLLNAGLLRPAATAPQTPTPQQQPTGEPRQ